jgi:aspartate 4-decarboxylase
VAELSREDREEKYEELSPFELKDKLISMAESQSEKMMLNAGRGNPNWVATRPRQAFFLLGNFAIEEGQRVMDRYGLAGAPEEDGMGDRFREFCKTHAEHVGADFLDNSYSYATEELGLDGDEFIGEMVDAVLGDHYPTPDRVLPNTQKVIRRYLDMTTCNDDPPEGTMDLFLTEGGTAAMTYVFNSLKENHLLNPGDKIALGTPIFTPYLEIPPLNDYQLEIVEIQQNEGNDWNYPREELEKLKDPSIKAFFVVNPSNPSSVSMSDETLDYIGDLVENERQDLILLTDDVYGTFVDDFRSLAAIAPRNTILVYSYSKYFGSTGWRLGTIGIHQDNVMDEMIADLPEEKRRGLHNRYEAISTNPGEMKLIDRLVADSRAVALNHTAGLSTPQQVMMVLFSLQELLDSDSRLYQKEIKDLVEERYQALYDALGASAPDGPKHANYYTTIDIPSLAEDRYGKEFAEWLDGKHESIDFVWRMADEKDVVVLDGGGFDAPEMSVRVSLANLYEDDYREIGAAISDLLEEYRNEWKESK